MPVWFDRGVAAFDEGLLGEDGVAADCVDVEAVAAHFVWLCFDWLLGRWVDFDVYLLGLGVRSQAR